MRIGKDGSDDPTGDFDKIDQVLPMKRGQTLDYLAKDIEGDLDWIRNKGDAPDSFGEISNTFRDETKARRCRWSCPDVPSKSRGKENGCG